MIKTTRENVMKGHDSSVDMDVLVERGRQLHSAAIGDVLINLFSGVRPRRDQSNKRSQALHHATGHKAH